MNSILDEISKLRSEKIPALDYQNSNRYRIVAIEEDGSKTAYCFATPIYNVQTRKLLDLRFHQNGDLWYMNGSNTKITFLSDARFENEEGFFKVSLPGAVTSMTEKVVACNQSEIYPTTNGLAFKVPCTRNEPYEAQLFVGHPFMNVRSNDKCFSLMSEEFRPFMTVSCIGTLDGSGRVIAPCEIDYQKNNDSAFTLKFRPQSPYGRFVLYEVNMYEAKLFQDTTVESRNSRSNNAFGGTAFLGNTSAYGEQWLYTRPDFSKVSELLSSKVRKAILHLPQHTEGKVELTAFRVANRFCSFGSNWDNKISAATELGNSVSKNDYQSLDITSLITDPQTHYITQSEGLILKTKVKGSGFTAVATGDSHYTPQVLEINFK